MDVLVAVDIGASSGRVILGSISNGRIEMQELHRFPNEPVVLPDGLHWDALRLHHEVLEGLGRAARSGSRVLSVGIDTWGCDVGWLDATGALLADPWHHRDPRNIAAAGRVHERITPAALFARNGLQYLPFNTLYQLEAARSDPAFGSVRRVLLIPDLLGYWLTGEVAAERTNASTTGLLDPRSGHWDRGLATLVGLDPDALPDIREPGSVLGTLRGSIAEATGLPATTQVTLVGSHDTASAVVAVPSVGDDFAYISSGTWSLVGVELEAPNLDEAGRIAGFTNEGGVDGRTRYLHNVMGLWLLNETRRAWGQDGTAEGLQALLDAAAGEPAGGPTFDVDAEVFLAPGDMPTRIEAACAAAGSSLPPRRSALVRAILDSLAGAYARTIDAAAGITARPISVAHVLGGGARNALLCQLTADATGLPVVAGPVEATALGNLAVQARALGLIDGDLARLRAMTRDSEPVTRYEPRNASRTA